MVKIVLLYHLEHKFRLKLKIAAQSVKQNNIKKTKQNKQTNKQTKTKTKKKQKPGKVI